MNPTRTFYIVSFISMQVYYEFCCQSHFDINMQFPGKNSICGGLPVPVGNEPPSPVNGTWELDNFLKWIDPLHFFKKQVKYEKYCHRINTCSMLALLRGTETLREAQGGKEEVGEV